MLFLIAPDKAHILVSSTEIDKAGILEVDNTSAESRSSLWEIMSEMAKLTFFKFHASAKSRYFSFYEAKTSWSVSQKQNSQKSEKFVTLQI